MLKVFHYKSLPKSSHFVVFHVGNLLHLTGLKISYQDPGLVGQSLPAPERTSFSETACTLSDHGWPGRIQRCRYNLGSKEKSACIAAGKTRPNTGYWEYYTFESKSQRRFWAIHSNVDIVDIETLHRPQTWPHGHMATRPHGHTHGHRLRSCSQPADRIKQDQTGSNRLDLQLAGFSLWWSVWQGQSTTPSALRSTAHSWEVLDSARHFNQKWNDLGEP